MFTQGLEWIRGNVQMSENKKCTQVDHGFLPAAIYQAGGVRGSLLCLGQSHYQPLDYFHVPDIIFRCRF